MTFISYKETCLLRKFEVRFISLNFSGPWLAWVALEIFLIVWHVLTFCDEMWSQLPCSERNHLTQWKDLIELFMNQKINGSFSALVGGTKRFVARGVNLVPSCVKNLMFSPLPCSFSSNCFSSFLDFDWQSYRLSFGVELDIVKLIQTSIKSTWSEFVENSLDLFCTALGKLWILCPF